MLVREKIYSPMENLQPTAMSVPASGVPVFLTDAKVFLCVVFSLSHCLWQCYRLRMTVVIWAHVKPCGAPVMSPVVL